MLKPWVIYVLKCPRSLDVRYVGIAQSAKNRLACHVSESRKKQDTPKQKWIFSVLETDLEPLLEVIEHGLGPGRKEAEQRWIADYRAAGADLTNSTSGGQGSVDRGTPEWRSAVARKANANRTPEEKRAAYEKTNAAFTSEMRSAALRKWQAAKTPEERSAVLVKGNANRTPEQKAAAAEKWRATMTPEKRSARAKKALAAMTPEQRSARAVNANASRSPEARRASAQKRIAGMTPEKYAAAAEKARASRIPGELSAAVKKAKAAMSPEERCAAAHKGWATRMLKLSGDNATHFRVKSSESGEGIQSKSGNSIHTVKELNE